MLPCRHTFTGSPHQGRSPHRLPLPLPSHPSPSVCVYPDDGVSHSSEAEHRGRPIKARPPPIIAPHTPRTRPPRLGHRTSIIAPIPAASPLQTLAE
eukprot:scaffold3448_cov107-Isochrysis_galbana.AAC.7